MSINVTKENEICRIDIAGDMNIYSAVQMKQELFAAMADCREAVINLARVSEIDAAGLQLLALASREAAARNITLTIVEHSHAVRDVLDLCNLELNLAVRLSTPQHRIERNPS